MMKTYHPASWFYSVDARAKIAGIFVLVVVSALLTDIRLIVASLVLAISLAALSRTSARVLLKAYGLALPVVLAASIR